MTIEPPLVHASEADLAAAVQENLFALFRAMTALPGSELVEGEKLSRHLASPSNPMYKGVWRTRLEKEELGDAIKDTIEWFKSRHTPFFFWWTGPGTTPHELDNGLMAHGLISMAEQAKEMAPGIISTEVGAPGMIADLRKMNEAVLMQVPAGFAIEEVHDEQCSFHPIWLFTRMNVLVFNSAASGLTATCGEMDNCSNINYGLPPNTACSGFVGFCGFEKHFSGFEFFLLSK